MVLSTLTAITPVDGRYRSKTEMLATYFSEYALIKYRILVEIEYFIALAETLPALHTHITDTQKAALRAIYQSFSTRDADRIKAIESETNHDVKAIEYFLKGQIAQIGLAPVSEFVHFGLTSQDVNNTAIPLSIRDALSEAYYPALNNIINQLQQYSVAWNDIPMLARTHGQPASPTRLGKEIMVYIYRIETQLAALQTVPLTAKFGGATGNFNAHHAAYPHHNWTMFADRFIEETLGLKRETFTTQISNYDNIAALFDAIKRINTILIDMCRDFWMYISMNYFRQTIKPGETGSSAMPHKVNPIDFENAEGNLGLANAILEHLSAKLPISRLQRDLTDSTVTRNIGLPFAHTLIAADSITKGLSKLMLNREAIARDLDTNWAVVAEGIQTILRREGFPNPYEALKDLTRTNGEITRQVIIDFVDSLDITDDTKSELKALSPHNYTGI